MNKKKSNPVIIFIGFLVVAVLVTVGVIFAVNYTPPATPAQKAAANAARAIYDLESQVASVGRLAMKNSGNSSVQSMGSEISDFANYDRQPIRLWIQTQHVKLSDTIVAPEIRLTLNRSLVQQMVVRRNVAFDSAFLSYLGKLKKHLADVETKTTAFSSGKVKTWFKKLQSEINGAYGILGGQS